MARTLSLQEIEDLFTREDGSYQFSRWGRSIAPVVFGVNDDILAALKAAMTLAFEREWKQYTHAYQVVQSTRTKQ